MIEASKESFLGAYVFLGRTFSFLSPNAWTLTSLLLAVFAAAFYAAGALFPAAVALALSVFSTVLDGAVAAVTRQKTAFGALLADSVAKYAEGFVVILMAFPALQLPGLGVSPLVLAAVAVLGIVLVDAVSARAELLYGRRSSNPLFGRPERLTLMVIYAFIASFAGAGFLTAGLFVLAVAAHLTVIVLLADHALRAG
jgi:phosphatidylglycerophosphate synthase